MFVNKDQKNYSYAFGSAITWALGGILLGVFFFNVFGDNDTSLMESIISAFFLDLFALVWAFILVCLVKRKISLRMLFPFHNKSIWILLLSTALGAPLGTVMYYMAIIEISATKASAISTLYPILATVLSLLYFKTKSRVNTYIGLFLSISAALSLGIIDVVNNPESNWKGYLFISIGVIAWSLEAFLSSISMKNDVDPIVSIFIRELVSVVFFLFVFLPAFGAYSNDSMKKFVDVADQDLYILFIGGFFISSSFMFYYFAINKIGIPRATSVNITYSFWTLLIELVFVAFSYYASIQEWYVYLLSMLILLGAIFGLIEFKNVKIFKRGKHE